MGQSKWAGACALLVVAGLVVSSRGEDAEQNPFAAGETAADVAPAEHHVDSSPDRDVFPTCELAKRRIEFILDQPLKSPLQNTETPLNTVTRFLSEEYDIPILFDTKALEAIAVSPDVQVSVELQSVTLRSALDLILKQVEDLAYIVDKEVLLITTEDEANKLLETRVYRVDNLWEFAKVEPPKGASAWADYSPLIDVVTTCVEPDSWNENDTGEGTIYLLPPGMLVIRQTEPIHAKVGKMLDELGRVKREIIESTSHGDAEHNQAALAP